MKWSTTRRFFSISFALFFVLVVAAFWWNLSTTSGSSSIEVAAQEPSNSLRLIRASIRQSSDKAKIVSIGVDVWETARDHIIGRATAGQISELSQFGISVEIIPRLPVPDSAPPPGQSGAFHSYAEVCSELQQLQDNFPAIAQKVNLGKSVEGRDICAIKISDNVATEEYEPEVLFDGCQHAREWISVEVPLLFAKYLVENYGSNTEVKNIVDNSAIWIVPMINPDGHQYTIDASVNHSDPSDARFWRKNRNVRGMTGPCIGVDLNRNWGFQWGLNSGSSGSPCTDVYRGPSPFSEPETQIISRLVSTHSFRAVIDYHSYAQSVLYPWGYTEDPAPDFTLLSGSAADMAAQITAVNSVTYLAQQQLYLVSGAIRDWCYGQCGTLGFTVELRQSSNGFLAGEEEIQPIFNESLAGQKFIINWARNRMAADLSIQPWGAARAPQEAPYWQTGDIYVDNDLDGIVNEPGEPAIGKADNKLFARITNRGNIASGSFAVKFSFVPFTTNSGGAQVAGPEMTIAEVSQTSLGAGAVRAVGVDWNLTSLPPEFQQTAHFCVKVAITPLLAPGTLLQTADINRCNNFAQTNFTNVVQVMDSSFKISFFVRNHLNLVVNSALQVTGLPDGWKITFAGLPTPQNFQLQAQEGKLVQAVVELGGRFNAATQQIGISQEINGEIVGGISINVEATDFCLQDDRSGDILKFNSFTGDYQFTRCGVGGFVLTGKGSISRTGCLTKLSDAKISATVNRCVIAPQNRGSATIKPNPIGVWFYINDSNTGNNICACH